MKNIALYIYKCMIEMMNFTLVYEFNSQAKHNLTALITFKILPIQGLCNPHFQLEIQVGHFQCIELYDSQSFIRETDIVASCIIVPHI